MQPGRTEFRVLSFSWWYDITTRSVANHLSHSSSADATALPVPGPRNSAEHRRVPTGVRGPSGGEGAARMAPLCTCSTTTATGPHARSLACLLIDVLRVTDFPKFFLPPHYSSFSEGEPPDKASCRRKLNLERRFCIFRVGPHVSTWGTCARWIVPSGSVERNWWGTSAPKTRSFHVWRGNRFCFCSFQWLRLCVSGSVACYWHFPRGRCSHEVRQRVLRSER